MLTIRKTQMQALNAYMRQSFEDRMVRHLAQAFPELYQAMLDPKGGDRRVRGFIQEGVRRAARYDIKSERDVALFIEVMAAVDEHFEEKPEMKWAAAILKDPSLRGDDRIWLVYNRVAKQRTERT